MRYFTSDLHLGHEAIIGYSGRPFNDRFDQTKGLGSLWAQTVERGDEVYVLGDVYKGTDDLLWRLASWPGRIRVVPGNHDRCHPRHADHEAAKDKFKSAGIKVLDPQVTISIAGQDVLLCHFPPTGDSREGTQRYPQWRPADEPGRWIVHGHVHAAWRQRGRWINVGVDAWAGRPVPEAALADLIAEGPRDRDRLDWVRCS